MPTPPNFLKPSLGWTLSSPATFLFSDQNTCPRLHPVFCFTPLSFPSNRPGWTSEPGCAHQEPNVVNQNLIQTVVYVRWGVLVSPHPKPHFASDRNYGWLKQKRNCFQRIRGNRQPRQERWARSRQEHKLGPPRPSCRPQGTQKVDAGATATTVTKWCLSCFCFFVTLVFCSEGGRMHLRNLPQVTHPNSCCKGGSQMGFSSLQEANSSNTERWFMSYSSQKMTSVNCMYLTMPCSVPHSCLLQTGTTKMPSLPLTCGKSWDYRLWAPTPAQDLWRSFQFPLQNFPCASFVKKGMSSLSVHPDRQARKA